MNRVLVICSLVLCTGCATKQLTPEAALNSINAMQPVGRAVATFNPCPQNVNGRVTNFDAATALRGQNVDVQVTVVSAAGCVH